MDDDTCHLATSAQITPNGDYPLSIEGKPFPFLIDGEEGINVQVNDGSPTLLTVSILIDGAVTVQSPSSL